MDASAQHARISNLAQRINDLVAIQKRTTARQDHLLIRQRAATSESLKKKPEDVLSEEELVTLAEEINVLGEQISKQAAEREGLLQELSPLLAHVDFSRLPTTQLAGLRTSARNLGEKDFREGAQHPDAPIETLIASLARLKEAYGQRLVTPGDDDIVRLAREIKGLDLVNQERLVGDGGFTGLTNACRMKLLVHLLIEGETSKDVVSGFLSKSLEQGLDSEALDYLQSKLPTLPDSVRLELAECFKPYIQILEKQTMRQSITSIRSAVQFDVNDAPRAPNAAALSKAVDHARETQRLLRELVGQPAPTDDQLEALMSQVLFNDRNTGLAGLAPLNLYQFNLIFRGLRLAPNMDLIRAPNDVSRTAQLLLLGTVGKNVKLAKRASSSALKRSQALAKTKLQQQKNLKKLSRNADRILVRPPKQ